MNFELRDRTIYLVVAGSHSYGFASPTSDWDYRGICIPPLDSYIGIMDKFEQIVDTEKGKHVYTHYPVGLLNDDPRVTPGADGPDMQVMELSKFARLAAQCNPSVIELLFTDKKFHTIKDPIMDRLLDNKEMFLSKAAKARFSGYAIAQLKRMRRHREWILNPPDHKPTREEFGLPNRSLLSQDQMGAAGALIQKEIDEFMIDQTHLPEDVKIELNSGLGKMMRAVWKSLHPDKEYPIGDKYKFDSTESALYWGVARDQNFSENFLEILNREKRYRAAKKEWDSYQHWLKNRNPARAATEIKLGFDGKNATHLIRLMRMCREILEKKEVNVFRHDAEELLAIRNGAWSYEEIVEFAEKEDAALDEVVRKSDLPRAPDIKKIHNLIHEMIIDFNKGK